MEETLEVLKIEKKKILSKLGANNENECYGESCAFKTAEEYQIMVGLLVNLTASIGQLEQTLEIKKRNEEQVAKMQAEAKEAK
jgi:hypothetical protein